MAGQGHPALSTKTANPDRFALLAIDGITCLNKFSVPSKHLDGRTATILMANKNYHWCWPLRDLHAMELEGTSAGLKQQTFNLRSSQTSFYTPLSNSHRQSAQLHLFYFNYHCQTVVSVGTQWLLITTTHRKHLRSGRNTLLGPSTFLSVIVFGGDLIVLQCFRTLADPARKSQLCSTSLVRKVHFRISSSKVATL